MLNEKQNQQGQGWVVPIAGAAITAISVIIAAIVPKLLEKLPFPEFTPKSTFGTIQVDAKLPGGEPFTNEYGSRKKYRFVASGEWTYNTTVLGIGMHSPAGHPAYPNASSHHYYYLPGSPEGALIVLREDNSYQLVGNEKILELQPNETVYFTINDTNKSNGNNYTDNDGSVTVEWQLRK